MNETAERTNAAANAQHKGDPRWKQVTPAPLTPEQQAVLLTK